jgi:hypothetical protein
MTLEEPEASLLLLAALTRMPRAISSEEKARAHILTREVREIPQNFVLAHAAGKIFEHIRHCDAQPADARLAAALVGFDRDDLAEVRNRKPSFWDLACLRVMRSFAG